MCMSIYIYMCDYGSISTLIPKSNYRFFNGGPSPNIGTPNPTFEHGTYDNNMIYVMCIYTIIYLVGG